MATTPLATGAPATATGRGSAPPRGAPASVPAPAAARTRSPEGGAQPRPDPSRPFPPGNRAEQRGGTLAPGTRRDEAGRELPGQPGSRLRTSAGERPAHGAPKPAEASQVTGRGGGRAQGEGDPVSEVAGAESEARLTVQAPSHCGSKGLRRANTSPRVQEGTGSFLQHKVLEKRETQEGTTDFWHLGSGEGPSTLTLQPSPDIKKQNTHVLKNIFIFH